MLKTDYKYELVLYPDSENYNCDDVIKKAQKYFKDWCYILHDLDKREDGSDKKPHYHFYGNFGSGNLTTPKKVASDLGLPENLSSLSNIKSWRSAVRYLTHCDYPENIKHHYNLEDVISNFDLTPFFSESKDDKDAFQAGLIFEYMKNNCPSLPQLTEYCLQNNLWGAFRRGFAIWAKLIGGYSNEGNRYSPHRDQK